MTATVADILRLKGTSIYAVQANACVSEAVAAMKRHGVGCLLITDGGSLLGLVSERDILQRVVAEPRDPERTRVSEIMTHSPFFVMLDTTIDAAKRLVTSTRCRHVPVIGPHGIAGVVSSGDLAAWDLRSLQHELMQMTAYIHGPLSIRELARVDLPD